MRRLGGVPVSVWSGVVENDFERTIVPLVPEVGEIKKRLYAEGAEYASMTGSGSAVFALFPIEVPDIARLFPEYFTWQEK